MPVMDDLCRHSLFGGVFWRSVNILSDQGGAGLVILWSLLGHKRQGILLGGGDLGGVDTVICIGEGGVTMKRNYRFCPSGLRLGKLSAVTDMIPRSGELVSSVEVPSTDVPPLWPLAVPR